MEETELRYCHKKICQETGLTVFWQIFFFCGLSSDQNGSDCFMDRFLQGSWFSFFAFIHLADKETYRLIGYAVYLLSRSEERRVEKECRYRW